MATTIDTPPRLAANGLRDQLREVRDKNARLRAENSRLEAENERLRRENGDLRRTLDVHVTRARSTALFGPLELTAGTSVGPRRRRQ